MPLRNSFFTVSVEPLPKQGCELSCRTQPTTIGALSQWNPCRSRGASRDRSYQGTGQVSVEPLPKQGCEWVAGDGYYGDFGSQWNPCRSRGASPPLECLDIAWGIGTFIHPPADLIVFCDFKEHLRDCSSNYYCLSSGSVFIHPSIRFLYPRFQSEVQHPALVPVRA